MKKSNLWTGNFVILLPLALFLFVNNTLYTSIATTYVAALGETAGIGALVNSANAIPALACRVFAGRLLDRGKRKSIVCAGIFVFCIAVVGYALHPGVWLLVVLRAVDGAAFSLATTACQTIATDVIPPERMAEGLSYYSMSNSLSQAISATIAVSLWNNFGFGAFPVVSFALMGLSLVLTVKGLRIDGEERHVKKAMDMPVNRAAGCREVPSEAAKGGLWRFFEKQALKSAVFMFSISVFNIIRMLYVPRYAIENNIAGAGIFFFLMACISIGVKLCSGKILKVLPARYILLLAITCNAVSFLCLLHMKNVIMLCFAAVLGGVATGIDQPLISAESVWGLPKERRGAANGTFMCGNDMSMIFGSGLWGLAVSVLGIEGLFKTASAGLFAVACAYGIYCIRLGRGMLRDHVL